MFWPGVGLRYGPLFALFLGPHYTLVINDHQHAREVLLQRGRDFAGRPSMVRVRWWSICLGWLVAALIINSVWLCLCAGDDRPADQRRERHRVLWLLSSLEVAPPPRPQLLHSVRRRKQPAAGHRYWSAINHHTDPFSGWSINRKRDNNPQHSLSSPGGSGSDLSCHYTAHKLLPAAQITELIDSYWSSSFMLYIK